MLSAAHVVVGATKVQIRTPNKTLYSTTLDPQFVGDVDGPRPDLALVGIDDPRFDLPPIGLAQVDRDSPTGEPVERCKAVGYPWFAETPTPTAVRDTVDAIGVVPLLSNLAAGLLSLQVSISPRALPPEQVRLGESEWAGMSGAPVVASGYLLGVVSEHAPREGSTITAVPLTALELDPAHPEWGPGVDNPDAWWARLGVADIRALRMLPPRIERRQPAYLDTLREFGQTLHARMPQLLGRERELAELAVFATGPAGYRWLVGGAFAGKTALLFEAVTAGLPAEVDVVCYFLSRRASDADSSRFLTAVVPQLASLCEIDRPTADRDQFNALWRQATERAVETGRPLLLVVDGLDEDVHPQGSPSVASLLPTRVDGVAHVLVSSRPHPELPGDVVQEHPLWQKTIRADVEPFEGAQELAGLARQEIFSLMHGGSADLAVNALGFLTAAAGPLSVKDLATLVNDLASPSAGQTRQVRRLVTADAARSLERVGIGERQRYQFAHYSLLEYAQATEDLSDPEYRNQIHRWAALWRNAGWPTTDATAGTPRYLLDNYPATLARDPDRLAALASDVGWVDAAIHMTGVDKTLADLRQAAAVASTHAEVDAMLAVVAGQAHHLRLAPLLNESGYVLRQLCLQATELRESGLADQLRARLLSQPGPGGLIPIWTTRRASRRLRGELGRHDDMVTAVAVLPGGRVVSGGGDGRVLVWDSITPGADPGELGRHDGWVTAVAVLPDGRVVTGGDDGRVLVWDPSTPGADPGELGYCDGSVTAVAVLPGGRVVTGGDDGRVLVWDPSTAGADPGELGYCDGSVTAVAVLPGGRVVTGADEWVQLWDPSTPGAEPDELGYCDRQVDAVAVLPDGRVVTGGDDGRVLVWDPSTPGADPGELGDHDLSASAVAVLPDGRVVTGGGDERVLVWDPSTPGADPDELGRHDGWVTAVAVLPDGRVVTGGNDERVLVWDPSTPGADPGELGYYDGSVTAVAVLPGGRVVTGGDDDRVLVWDPITPGADPGELGRHDDSVTAVAVLPGGRVVTGGGDGRVLVWDPSTPGADPGELGRHDDSVTAVAVLPGGRVVSGGGDGRVLVWDPSTPRADPGELGRHDDSVTAVAVLPGGRVVSGGDDGRVLVWDPSTPGADPGELGRHEGSVTAVAVLPDGRVVTGGNDRRVLVWDPSTPGADPGELGRHEGSVTAVAVLPDGRVVTGGNDERVLVWDVTQGRESAQLGCTVAALAVEPPNSHESCLAIGHQGAGFSLWTVIDQPHD